MDSSESSSEGTSTPPVSTPVPPAVPPVIPQDPISQAQFPRTSIPRADFAPPPPPPAAPVPGRSGRSGGGAWKWVALGVSVVLVISLLALFGVLFAKSDLNWTHHHPTQSPGAAELHEVVVRESPFEDKVAVISLEGVISGQVLSDIGSSLVELVGDQLERAAVEGVSAVILKVDSPGGEVLASDEIYLLIEKFQKEHDIPVVASMGSLAASGGYYVSAPCRWIVANELTMTGSIGVIFHSYNYRGLMDKVGVRPDITKSGKLKDMMSGEKLPEEVLPEERAILQGMIDESYAKFKDIIRTGRNRAAELNQKDGISDGRKLALNWTEFADGRILSGQQAMDLGLVDELGNFEVAVDRAFKLAGLDGAKLVAYHPQFRFPGFLSLLGQARSGSVKVDLGLPLQSRLPEGRLYFMSPLHLH
jgi:protease-4